MEKFGLEASILQLAMRHRRTKKDCCCSSLGLLLVLRQRDCDLQWFHDVLKGEFDVTAARVGPKYEKEVKCLN